MLGGLFSLVLKLAPTFLLAFALLLAGFILFLLASSFQKEPLISFIFFLLISTFLKESNNLILLL